MVERASELVTGAGGVAVLSGLGVAFVGILIQQWLSRDRTRIQIRFVSPTYNRVTRRLEVSVSAAIVPPTPGSFVSPLMTCSARLNGVPIAMVEEQQLRQQVGGLWMGRFAAYSDLVNESCTFRAKVTIRTDHGGRASKSEDSLQFVA